VSNVPEKPLNAYIGTVDDGGWNEWSRLILHQISELAAEAEKLDKTDRENYDKLGSAISALRENLSVAMKAIELKVNTLETENKMRAGLWGAITGSAVSAGFAIIVWFVTH
jgi:hypothetical protein